MQATNQNSAMHLHSACLYRNIASLTKNSNTPCHASKLAFFVPKICRKLPGLVISHCAMGAKNRFRISQYGRVNGRIKDLFGGNKPSRVTAISDTRPPVTKTGGLTKNSNGGQSMPLNTSHSPMQGQNPLSISLPADSFINEFLATYNGHDWELFIVTTKGQTSIVKGFDGLPLRFHHLGNLAKFLADNEAENLRVSLLGLNRLGGEL